MIIRLLARLPRPASWPWFSTEERRSENTINSRISSGSRHLQIHGPVDGHRLILHHLPLERTVARPPWPAAALNLVRRHRHFRPVERIVAPANDPGSSEFSRTIAGNGDADAARNAPDLGVVSVVSFVWKIFP